MITKINVVGGTGAIGAAIVNCLQDEFQVNAYNSNTLPLHVKEVVLGDIQDCDVFINASGSYGGLKGYIKNNSLMGENFKENLKRISLALNCAQRCQMLINISSASVFEQKNKLESSPYSKYVQEKADHERIFEDSFCNAVIQVRPTNIVSRYERIDRSHHVVASLTNLILSQTNYEYRIWSNAHDWREFCDADDLALLIKKVVLKEIKLKQSNVVACSMNETTTIKNLFTILHNLLKPNAQYKVVMTEPFRTGPLHLLLRAYCSSETHIVSKTPIEESLKKLLLHQGLID